MKTKARLWLVVGCVVASVAAPVGATDIYVNNLQGSDTNGNGSCLRPYETIARAAFSIDLAAPPADNTIFVQASYEVRRLTPPPPEGGLGGECYEQVPNPPYEEYVQVQTNKVTIRPYHRAEPFCLALHYFDLILQPPKARGGDPGTSGAPGVQASFGANVNLRHMEIHGQDGGDGVGTNANGGKGGRGVYANGGSLLTKFKCKVFGGEGGKGSNEADPGEPGGNGAPGGEGEVAKDSGSKIKNFFGSPSKGGGGGAGGTSASGTGGEGGDGGVGSRTENGGRIETAPSAQPTGGAGGEGGSGSPSGTAGDSAPAESGPQIVDVPEGDLDEDGTADHLDNCPEDSSPGCLPPGGCVTGGGACSVVTSDDCDALQGSYQGPGTTCPPGTCQVPTVSAVGSIALALGMLALMVKVFRRPIVSTGEGGVVDDGAASS